MNKLERKVTQLALKEIKEGLVILLGLVEDMDQGLARQTYVEMDLEGFESGIKHLNEGTDWLEALGERGTNEEKY